MRCRKARALAHDFLEGTLAAEARGRVERHIGSCRRCGKAFEEARRYREAVLSLSRVKAPDDFLSGIREKLGESPAPEKRRNLFALPHALPFGFATAAAAAVALVVALHALRPAGERPFERGVLSGSRDLEEDRGAPVEPKPAGRSDEAHAARPVPENAVGKKTAPAERSEKTYVTRESLRETDTTEAPAGAGKSTAPSGVSSETKDYSDEKERAGDEATTSSPAPGTRSEPKALSITLVLAPPAGGMRGDRHSARKAGQGPGREKAAVVGEPAGPDPEKIREALRAVIRNAGGRVVGEEPPAAGVERDPEGQTPERLPSEDISPLEGGPGGVFPAILAEIPAPALPDVLKRLGEIGQVREDGALTLSGHPKAGETVELRIRVTY